MLSKQLRVILLALLVFVVLLAVDLPTQGQEALNVGLLRFEAIPAADGVRLEWDVETEIGTAGYTIKRGQNGIFEYLSDPAGGGNLFVTAKGGVASAASYVFLDDTAVYDATYTYQLIEITTASSEQVQGEFTVIFHIEPTSTPIAYSGAIGGPGGGNNTSPTATPAASAAATVTSRAPVAPTNPPPPTRIAPTPLPQATDVPPPEAVDIAPPSSPVSVSSPEAPYPGDTLSVGQAAGEQMSQITEPDPTGDLPQVQSVQITLPTDNTAASALAMETSPAGQETVQNADISPVVIAGTVSSASVESYGLGNRLGATQEDEPPAYTDSANILLWVAFIIALGVFSASVVGAILLYSRQR